MEYRVMARSDHSDALLLARVPAPEAVGALYERHVDAIYRFALRRCSNPQDVGDLVASVFVEMFAAAGSYDRRRGSARAWLLGIAVRCLADQQRVGYRQAELERRVGVRVEFELDEFEMVVDEIDAARAAPVVTRALSAELTDDEREIFLLVAADGLSVANAARALGVTAGAGRMRLARARRKLRLALEAPGRHRDQATAEGGRT
jgi:RNA polymerase sigma factor (sigma-70 family)